MKSKQAIAGHHHNKDTFPHSIPNFRVEENISTLGSKHDNNPVSFNTTSLRNTFHFSSLSMRKLTLEKATDLPKDAVCAWRAGSKPGLPQSRVTRPMTTRSPGGPTQVGPGAPRGFTSTWGLGLAQEAPVGSRTGLGPHGARLLLVSEGGSPGKRRCAPSCSRVC